MKKIISYLKNFLRDDYSFTTYFIIFIFLVVSILLNYHYEIENDIIEEQGNDTIRFFYYLMLYGVAYYSTLIIYYFTRKKNYFLNKEVMLKSFVAILILAIDGTYSFTQDFFIRNFSANVEEARYLKKVINSIAPLIIYLISLYIIKRKYDSETTNLYGLSPRKFDWKPYFIMLLVMLPLIFWASFQQDFTQEYPVFKYWKMRPVFGMTQEQLFSFYEIFYLLDFINVEILFRGLLVIGMIKCMGEEAILPMVVTYAFLHFGKPPAETVGSIFGGYILGVIALRSENILGGYMIHMGVAFLMDIFAILQLKFFK